MRWALMPRDLRGGGASGDEADGHSADKRHYGISHPMAGMRFTDWGAEKKSGYSPVWG